jgi:hypothetical protein
VDRAEGIKFDLAGMFDFKGPQAQKLILSPATGEPTAPPHKRRHHGKK